MFTLSGVTASFLLLALVLLPLPVQAAIPRQGLDSSLIPRGGIYRVSFGKRGQPLIVPVELALNRSAAHDDDRVAAAAAAAKRQEAGMAAEADPAKVAQLEHDGINYVYARLPITDVVCDVWGVRRSPPGLMESKYWFHEFCDKHQVEKGEMIAFSNRRDDQIVFMCNHGGRNPCSLPEVNSALGVLAVECPDQFGRVYMREWAKSYGLTMRGLPLCEHKRLPWYENVLRTMYAWNFDWQSWNFSTWQKPDPLHVNAWSDSERKKIIDNYHLSQGGYEVYKIDPKYSTDDYPPGFNWQETRPFYWKDEVFPGKPDWLMDTDPIKDQIEDALVPHIGPLLGEGKPVPAAG